MPKPVFQRPADWPTPQVPWESYCKTAHGDEFRRTGRPMCTTYAEHKARVAEGYFAIDKMIRTLDHTIEVGSDRKWGQTTLQEVSGD